MSSRNTICLYMAIRSLRASWNVFSSSQPRLCLSREAAILLCARKKIISAIVNSGFRLILGSPATCARNPALATFIVYIICTLRSVFSFSLPVTMHELASSPPVGQLFCVSVVTGGKPPLPRLRLPVVDNSPNWNERMFCDVRSSAPYRIDKSNIPVWKLIYEESNNTFYRVFSHSRCK